MFVDNLYSRIASVPEVRIRLYLDYCDYEMFAVTFDLGVGELEVALVKRRI